jgi:cyclophilin family peptidyl-prolyl cis-trans isomerase
MARTNKPHISQFFINAANNWVSEPPPPAVPVGYAVFGKVISGTGWSTRSNASRRTKMGHGDVPVDVVIEKKRCAPS